MDELVPRSTTKKYLKHLFYGRTAESTVANDIMLAINLVVIFISLYSLFFTTSEIFLYVEFGFGILFTVEYVLRFWLSRHKRHFVFRLVNVVDIILITSLLSTAFVPNLAFLRILRTLQILRAYKLFGKRFDHHSSLVYRNFEVITASLNLIIFLFVMSTAVYIQQVSINENITNYIDALYYTISAVTTTGFGDIIVVGAYGEMLSITIMILGVTLFFRLIKSLFVPHRLYAICTGCGKDHHTLDARYCGNCGHKIKNRYYIDRMQRHKDDF